MTEGKKVYKLSTYTPINKIPMSQDSVMDLDTLCIFASATEKTQKTIHIKGTQFISLA